MEGGVKLEDRFLDLTFSRLLRVWWSVSWRTLVFVVGGAFPLGFIIGMVAAMMGVSPDRLQTLATIVGVTWGFVAGLLALSRGLQAKFKEFEIRLVRKEGPDDLVLGQSQPRRM